MRSADTACLLGAVYGDGSIEDRGASIKVAVSADNKRPSWPLRITELFERVFGSSPLHSSRTATPGFTEYYLHLPRERVWDAFGLTSKYVPGHPPRLSGGISNPDARKRTPPPWIEPYAGSFALGLVETDGWFLPRRDRRCRTERYEFGFAQKDEMLALWMWSRLVDIGVVAGFGWGEASGTWWTRVGRQDQLGAVATWLGEPCSKWGAIAQFVDPSVSPAKSSHEETGVRRRRAEELFARNAVREDRPLPHVSPSRIGVGAYLTRRDAVSTYSEAKRVVLSLPDPPRTRVQYLRVAAEHGLPTQPEKQWAHEWSAGGGYPGFLSQSFTPVEPHWLSAETARKRLGIGHAAWKRLVADLVPDGSVAHKQFYDPARLCEHLRNVAPFRMRESDSQRVIVSAGVMCAK